MPPKKKPNQFSKKLLNLENLLTATTSKLGTYEEEVTEICEFLDKKRSDKTFSISKKVSFVEKLERALSADTHSPNFIEHIRSAKLLASLNLISDRFGAVTNLQALSDAFLQYHQLLTNSDLIRIYFDSTSSNKQERLFFEFVMTHNASVNATERCIGGLNFEAGKNIIETEPLKKMLDSLMMVEELINIDHAKEIKKSILANKMANLLPAVRQEFLNRDASGQLAAVNESTQIDSIKLALSRYIGDAKTGRRVDPVLIYSYLLRKQSYATQSTDDLGYHIALGIEKTKNSSLPTYSKINGTLVDLYFEHELIDILLENGRNISSKESQRECRELFKEYATKRPIASENAKFYIKGYSASGDLEFLQLESLSAIIAEIDDESCRKLDLYQYLFEALLVHKEYAKIVELGTSAKFREFCHSQNNIGRDLLIYTIDAEARLNKNFTAKGYEKMSELDTGSLDSLAQIAMYGCQASSDSNEAAKLVQKFTKEASKSGKNEDLICAVFDSFATKYPCFKLQDESGRYQITDKTAANSTIACCQNILALVPQDQKIQTHYSKLLFKIYSFQDSKDEALNLLPKIYEDSSEARAKADSLIANWDKGIAELGDIFDAKEISFLEKYYLQSLTERLISEEKLRSRQKKIDQIRDNREHDSSKTTNISEEIIYLAACHRITDSQGMKYFIHCPETLLGELDRATENKFRTALSGKDRFAKSHGETGIKHVKGLVVELKIRGNQRILGLIYHNVCDQDGERINIIKLSEYCANSHDRDNHSSPEFNQLLQKLSREKSEPKKGKANHGRPPSPDLESVVKTTNVKDFSAQQEIIH